MIQGIGTDIVEVSRIEKIIEKWGPRFIERVYTPGEIEYCSKKAFPAMHFAARFAVKESILKSLGIGLGKGLRLRDIEVLNNQEGSPFLQSNDAVKEVFRRRGISGVHISITHTKKYAQAVVILEK
ncbi:MAG: holo-ACP synthase [Deltaproteobacteria bacterium]|nr:holo-ACP synthase [Deltaproteobacteria bacterium]